MRSILPMTLLFALVASGPAFAEEALTAVAVQSNLNFVWTLIAAFLVFFMQAGFAMVEAGFTRAKNAANILMKNFMDFGMGSIAFFFVGFGLMFGAYLVFSVAMCAIVHPVFGSWAWGSLYKAHRLRLL